MGVFEYLGVLLSVIMGLGVTHLLAGVSKSIHHRKSVRHYWVHSMWALNVLIYIVAIWWGMFWWSGVEEWSFFRFLLLILYAILLFLAASLIFPWDLPSDFDFKSHFFETRPWLFAVLCAAWVVDVPETILKAEIGVRDLPNAYIAFVVSQITFAIAGAVSANEVFHRFYAVFWPVATLGYLSWSTLAEIAG